VKQCIQDKKSDLREIKIEKERNENPEKVRTVTGEK
jgi:hypothetical protein